MILVLPEIRWIDQVFPRHQLKPVQDGFVALCIAQAVLRNMQVNGLDASGIELAFRDGRVSRVVGNSD